MAKKMTLVIDADRCFGCRGCEVACKQENGVALGSYWTKVKDIGPSGKYPDLQMYFLPTFCQACHTPECVKACPTGASYQRPEDGIVLIDREKCIGCRYCIMACPYEARTFNKEMRVVEKCTMCAHLQAVGDRPACVKACSAQARFFGDLNDPNSDVSRALREAGSGSVHSLPDAGNQPSVRYILHRKTAEWKEMV
jgi:Fe-S-cluster-containing dehydrogenase component